MSALHKLSFIEATQQRRTIRKLRPTSLVPDQVIKELAEKAILDVPSAFNSQTTRISVLLNDQHRKLWSITADVLSAKVGKERWESGTKDRIDAFAAAYGTILFWDDMSCVTELKDNSPDIYKDKVDEWAHQSNGMHQYHLWCALGAMGLGANLQHYNPLIDAKVRKVWDIPAEWALRAQMVFGTPDDGSAPGMKEQKLPVEKRLKVFGYQEGPNGNDSL